MAMRLSVENGEVRFVEAKTSRAGMPFLNVNVVTYSYVGKDKKPEPENVRVTIFEREGSPLPTINVGDRIEIEKATFKMGTNPNYVQIKRELLDSGEKISQSDMKDSRFPDVTAGADQVKVSPADPTKKKKFGSKSMERRTKIQLVKDDPLGGIFD